jgi:hypothetical protein
VEGNKDGAELGKAVVGKWVGTDDGLLDGSMLGAPDGSSDGETTTRFPA